MSYKSPKHQLKANKEWRKNNPDYGKKYYWKNKKKEVKFNVKSDTNFLVFCCGF